MPSTNFNGLATKANVKAQVKAHFNAAIKVHVNAAVKVQAKVKTDVRANLEAKALSFNVRLRYPDQADTSWSNLIFKTPKFRTCAPMR